jgi:hypothetical protein
MTRFQTSKRGALALSLVALVGACAAEGAQEDDEQTTSGHAQGLTIGDRGEDVRKVYEYLATYGYFPNPELAEAYPGFEPLVKKAPADTTLYDANLAEAVRRYQENMGVEATGSADAETLTRMQPRTCSHPDGYELPGRGHEHTNNKYIVNSHTAGFSWSLDSFPVGTWPNTNKRSTIEGLVQQMVDQWKTVHPAGFPKVAPGTGSVRLRFVSIDGRATDSNGDGQCDSGCVAGRAGGSVIDFDKDELWEFTGTPTTTVPWPQRRVDFRGILLHEFGHSIGLGHSSLEDAAMYYQYVRGSVKRTISRDDTTAIRASAATWIQVSTPAPVLDISTVPFAFVSTEQQVPGVGGNVIYSFASGSWQQVPGGAVRISGDNRWRPWIVRDDNQIRVRRSDNTAWIPISGCATDIGVGRGRYVFIVGCDGRIQVGNMDAFADDATLYNQRDLGFTPIPHDGPNFYSVAGFETSSAAAVDVTGATWAFGGASMVRIPFTANHSMSDIGAAPSAIWGVRNSGTGVFAANLQAEIRVGDKVAVPGMSGWVGYPTRSAKRVAVADNGKPFVVDTTGALWTTSK